jgi:hypothetical protein
MNTETNTPAIVGNVLIRYNTSRFSTSRVHSEGTGVLHHNYGATRNLSAAIRILDTKGTVLGEILSLFTTTLAKLKKLGLTLPDKQGTIIRCSEIEQAQQIYEEADAKLIILQEKLRFEYGNLVVASRLALQDASRTVDYPDAAEVASQFSHHFGVFNAPGVVGFLEGVSSEIAAKTRAQSVDAHQRMMREAFSSLIKGLVVSVLGDNHQSGIALVLENAKLLRGSRFQRLREDLLHARAAQLSVGMHFPELDEVIAELEPIAEFDLDHLREDGAARTEAANRARRSGNRAVEILRRMGGRA